MARLLGHAWAPRLATCLVGLPHSSAFFFYYKDGSWIRSTKRRERPTPRWRQGLLQPGTFSWSPGLGARAAAAVHGAPGPAPVPRAVRHCSCVCAWRTAGAARPLGRRRRSRSRDGRGVAVGVSHCCAVGRWASRNLARIDSCDAAWAGFVNARRIWRCHDGNRVSGQSPLS